ncbi:MAG TPA: ATP-binding protein [Flavobacteriales bacterium]|nr:ATP-binding protein [Flavobacteriales bacterium]
MTVDPTINITTLYKEINWLEEVIDQVIKTYLLQEGHERSWLDIPVPELTDNKSVYAQKIKEWGLNAYARLALALTMAPHMKPEALDIFFGKNQLYDRGFTEFGGVADKNHTGFLPTGRTLSFLLTSVTPQLYNEVIKILDPAQVLMKEKILVLAETDDYIPSLNGIFSLSNYWFHYFITGKFPLMEQSPSFPAQKITTPLNWEDVVLHYQVSDQLSDISTWLEHGHVLMQEWGLAKKIKPGYRALFYGPPGTGKTLTATLLGKSTGRDVYKIDLSMVVSKYIGETEKNLGKIFDTAEHKNWILFFDEADALFGKRTAANSSNDRHANQQTAYLLQRIEDFPGTVILASNLKGNMDEAFTRRFQSIIYFGMPDVEERFKLWKNAFENNFRLDPAIDLYKIAEEFELAGGSIINILRYCALKAVNRNDQTVTEEDLLQGIKKEYKKENRTLNVIK